MADKQGFTEFFQINFFVKPSLKTLPVLSHANGVIEGWSSL